MRHNKVLLNILLSIHFAAGIFASGREWFYPFSASKSTSRYIKENGLDNLPMLGVEDTSACVIAGYLDRLIYYPEGDRFGSFVIFDKKSMEAVSVEMVFEKALMLALDNRSNVLLILSKKLPMPDAGINIEFKSTKPGENVKGFAEIVKLKEFDKSMQAGEKFYLYLLKYSGR